ncbi:hypothetical protein AB0B06_32400 [Streptomyces sp. NPDC044989]
MNAYVVRAARRAATLDVAKQLATLGLGDDLAGEGDTLWGNLVTPRRP